MNDHLIKQFREKISHSPIGSMKRAIFPPPPRMANIPRPILEADHAIRKPRTLILVVAGRFNQDYPDAGTLTPLGFAHGWTEINGPVVIVQDIFLMRELSKYDNPVIFLSVYNVPLFSISDCKKLRAYDTFIWSSIHPSKIEEFKKVWLHDKNQQDTITWEKAHKKIIAIEPNFLWNSVGQSGMHWYDPWIKEGLKWVTIHPAADITHYFPDPSSEYEKYKIAYVGGYWKEKAQAFDTYLKPLGKDFTPFGYAKWPYENYGGRLEITEERKLYGNAGLIPLVTGPAGWLIAEITERYLKAPACKAFCIADENSAVREIFEKNEMLQAESADHFHYLVSEFLKGNINTKKWREAGYKAVQEKHLYRHRAQQIIDEL